MKLKKVLRTELMSFVAFQASKASTNALADLRTLIWDKKLFPRDISASKMLITHEKGSIEDMKIYRVKA